MSLLVEEASTASTEDGAISKNHMCLLQLFNSSWHTPGYCGPTFDAVLCWPETAPNTTVHMDCPLAVDDHLLIENGQASRYCHPNGTWEMLGDYSACILKKEFDDSVLGNHADIMYWIYVIGYTFSFIVCILALTIFIHYKNLWCLRNIIHTNIVACFAVHNVTWLLFTLFSLHTNVVTESSVLPDAAHSVLDVLKRRLGNPGGAIPCGNQSRSRGNHPGKVLELAQHPPGPGAVSADPGNNHDERLFPRRHHLRAPLQTEADVRPRDRPLQPRRPRAPCAVPFARR